MIRFIACGVAGALVLMAFSSPAQAEVRITMQDGKVSIMATNATVREILAEWARVGNTKIVNGEKVAGSPLTLQLVDVPEDMALRTVLRTVSGYVAAPRPVRQPTASLFDRILVMPTSSAPAAAPRNAGPSPAPPIFAPPQLPPALQQALEGDQDAQETVGGAARRPVFNPFPQPQLMNLPDQQETQQAQPTPQAYPTLPVGTSRPGMIVEPTQAPGQPNPQNPE